MPEDEQLTHAKSNGFPILLAAVALAATMGSATFAVSLLMGTRTHEPEEALGQPNKDDQTLIKTQPFIFIPLEPVLVTLGVEGNGQQLRFEGYLEVSESQKEQVNAQMPRIMDALNTYLRAVAYEDLQEPASLIKLRIQMLRRAQMAIGEGAVKDLLISKFILG